MAHNVPETGYMPDCELEEALDPFGDLPIDIRVELDRLYLNLADILTFKAGDVLPLSKPAGEPLDIYAGGALLGDGEVMALNGNLGVRITAHAASARKLVLPHRWDAPATDVVALMKSAPDEFRKSQVLEPLLEGLIAVAIVVGRTWLPLERALTLATGTFLELEGTLHHPVEVVADDRVLAHGEVVVIDGNYGVRIQSVAVHLSGLASGTRIEHHVVAPLHNTN